MMRRFIYTFVPCFLASSASAVRLGDDASDDNLIELGGWWKDAWNGVQSWYTNTKDNVNKAWGDNRPPRALIAEAAAKLVSKVGGGDQSKYEEAITHCSWILSVPTPTFDNITFQIPEDGKTGMTFQPEGPRSGIAKVVVTKVFPGSAADAAGFHPGMLLLEVRGKPVKGMKSTAVLKKAMDDEKLPSTMVFDKPNQEVRRKMAVRKCQLQIAKKCSDTDGSRPLEVLIKEINPGSVMTTGGSKFCARLPTRNYMSVDQDPFEELLLNRRHKIDIPMPILHLNLPDGVPAGTDIVKDPDIKDGYIIAQDTPESRKQCLYAGMPVSLMEKKGRRHVKINARSIGSKSVEPTLKTVTDGGEWCGPGEKYIEIYFMEHGQGSDEDVEFMTHWERTFGISQGDMGWAGITFPDIKLRTKFQCDSYMADSFREAAEKAKSVARSDVGWGAAKIGITLTAGVSAIIFPPLAVAAHASATGIWAGAVGINSAATALKATASGLHRVSKGESFEGNGEFLWDMTAGLALGAVSASGGHLFGTAAEHMVKGASGLSHLAKDGIAAGVGYAGDVGTEAILEPGMEKERELRLDKDEGDREDEDEGVVANTEDGPLGAKLSEGFEKDAEKMQKQITRSEEDLVVRTDDGVLAGVLSEECLSSLSKFERLRHQGKTMLLSS
eukprot:TRINITY_DN8466_c0_g1_i1.p1 TRINITY_DN8466_c0_g1~~TRINITY_DN8466_c0_g1_i1.p1  ORF type:complete len:685 (+),score=127.87 TRINITY_DN8466_c0_g1_i1:49-2055(+)